MCTCRPPPPPPAFVSHPPCKDKAPASWLFRCSFSPQGYDAFCVNGVTFPDRSPHPALYEAKFLAQPVGIELLRDDHHPPPLGEKKRLNEETIRKSGSPGSEPRVLFSNRYAFSSLDHLSIAWRLESSASAAVASGADSTAVRGRLPLSGLLPGKCREVSVDIDRDDVDFAEPLPGGGGGGGDGGRGDGRELFLHIEARLAGDTAWASEGHLVAWACFALAGTSPTLPPPQPPAVGLEGGSGEAEEGVEGGGASQTVVVATPSHGFIAYEDEEGSAQSSREASPLGQL